MTLALSFLVACADPNGTDGLDATARAVLDSTQRVALVGGFSGPEAVRYDPEQDVYFVSNFNGGGGDRDNNGFISRVQPDGTIDSLHFAAGGTEGVTMHAPRGMALSGDTLWAADADGLLGFDRQSGALLAFVDFTSFEPGFLNDVIPGPDGALYVTDTGKHRVYRRMGEDVSIAIEDTMLARPNGITWDAARERFLIVPFGGPNGIFSWAPGSVVLEPAGMSTGASYDGVEVLADGSVLVASQADSSLHLFDGNAGSVYIRTAGRPADIGIDTRRNRVAVPFVALDQVEIWQLP